MQASTKGNSCHHPKPSVVSGASSQPFLSRHLDKREKPIILKAGNSNLLYADRGHNGGSLCGQAAGIDTRKPCRVSGGL